MLLDFCTVDFKFSFDFCALFLLCSNSIFAWLWHCSISIFGDFPLFWSPKILCLPKTLWRFLGLFMFFASLRSFSFFDRFQIFPCLWQFLGLFNVVVTLFLFLFCFFRIFTFLHEQSFKEERISPWNWKFSICLKKFNYFHYFCLHPVSTLRISITAALFVQIPGDSIVIYFIIVTELVPLYPSNYTVHGSSFSTIVKKSQSSFCKLSSPITKLTHQNSIQNEWQRKIIEKEMDWIQQLLFFLLFTSVK